MDSLFSIPMGIPFFKALLCLSSTFDSSSLTCCCSIKIAHQGFSLQTCGAVMAPLHHTLTSSVIQSEHYRRYGCLIQSDDDLKTTDCLFAQKIYQIPVCHSFSGTSFTIFGMIYFLHVLQIKSFHGPM
jgi:hypothetical protein